MLSSDYYIFTKRRSSCQKHPLGLALGVVLLVASAVHLFVVDLAARDRGSYEQQHLRFAFAQPGFRSYLAGKAAWERHIAISRVLTRDNPSDASATVQSVLRVTHTRDAKEDVVEPPNRAMQMQSVASGAVLRNQ